MWAGVLVGYNSGLDVLGGLVGWWARSVPRSFPQLHQRMTRSLVLHHGAEREQIACRSP